MPLLQSITTNAADYTITVTGNGGEEQFVICASPGQSGKWALFVIHMRCDMGGTLLVYHSSSHPIRDEDIETTIYHVFQPHIQLYEIGKIIARFNLHFKRGK